MLEILTLLIALEDPPAQPPKRECYPLVDALESMAEVDFFPMPLEAITPMLMFHNASPPPSDDHYKAAAYGTHKSGAGLVIWLDGDQACQRDMIPPAAWQRILPLIEGTRT